MRARAKEPKAEARRWFPPSGEPANDTEHLFIALLVTLARTSVPELKEWAADVRRGLTEGSEELPTTAEWRMANDRPGAMLAPVYRALRRTVWEEPELQKVATAMQAWHGPGSTNGLAVGNLRYYLTSLP